MDKMHENRVPGQGDVTITIDGKDYILTPSWNAAKQISRVYGGIGRAVERCLQVDTECLTDVIFLGMGYGTNKRPPQGLDEKIWKEGFTDDTGALVDKLVLYLRCLSRGGRLPDDAASGGDGEEGSGSDPR
jgi:hypothetical protein